MDLLYLSSFLLQRRPQTGIPCKLAWSEFAGWLSEPVWGSTKNAEGGYSPGLYRENIRHLDKLVGIGAVVFDIDINGDVDRVADALTSYSCVVHETYSSTKESPRCRLVVELKAPIDGVLYSQVYRILCMELKKLHVWPDENAKDASRLSYSPVRALGAGYRFREVKGAPVDALALTRVHLFKPVSAPISVPSHPNDKKLPRRSVTPLYLESAILSAQHNVGVASEGARHATLLKAVWGLSRSELGLTLELIEEALLPTAVAKMGAHRTHEARSAIRDAYARRRDRS